MGQTQAAGAPETARLHPGGDRLWQRLRGRQVAGAKFRRQHAIERFIVDFYCAETRLIVEVDGPIHAYTPEEDAIRQAYLEALGFLVQRFSNEAVMGDMDTVIEAINASVTTRRP